MFTTNLDAIKIQQKELQRRAAQERLVKSLRTFRGTTGQQKDRAASQADQAGQGTYTLSRAAR